MGLPSVLEGYKSLADISALMRGAAHSGDWQQFFDMTVQRDRLVDTLKAAERHANLDDSDIPAKRRLIEQILADEGETRRFVEAWMAQFRMELQDNQQELRLLKEYNRLG